MAPGIGHACYPPPSAVKAYIGFCTGRAHAVRPSLSRPGDERLVAEALSGRLLEAGVRSRALLADVADRHLVERLRDVQVRRHEPVVESSCRPAPSTRSSGGARHRD